MTSLPSNADQIIDAVYDLALDPLEFEQFAETWDSFLAHASNTGIDNEELNNLMLRHFERAMITIRKIGRKGTDLLTIEEQVNSGPSPRIAITDQGLVLLTNKAAQTILPHVKIGGFIGELLHSDSLPIFDKTLVELLSHDGVKPVMVLLKNEAPSLFLLKRIKNQNVTLLDIGGASWSDKVTRRLKQSYSLTAKECEVLEHMYQGLTVKQAAVKQNRSEDTLRTHVRSILRKTSSTSQIHLMRTVTSMNFVCNSEQSDEWFSDRIVLEKLTLSDGRSLSYYQQGKPSDKPILVVHGIIYSPELPNSMSQSLQQAGYRIIGVCRAGYGHSSAPTNPNELLQESVADTRELLDHLSIHQTHILGFMSGSNFAYAVCAELSDRVRGLICISGAMPFMPDEYIQKMPAAARALGHTARYFPKLYPLFVQGGVSFVHGGDIKRLIAFVYQNSPVDLAASEDPQVLEQITRGFRFTVHQGYSTYAFGGLTLMNDNRHYIDKITCSIGFIHGLQDGLVTRASLEEFLTKYPQTKVWDVDDSGQLAVYSKTKLVSKLLLQALSESHTAQ